MGSSHESGDLSSNERSGSAQRADGGRGTVLEVADIAGLAHLVRLAAAAGDEDAVSVAGVGHVGPAESGDFRPPQPAHEQKPGDHGVQPAARGRHLVGLDAAAVNGRAWPRPRSAVVRR